MQDNPRSTELLQSVIEFLRASISGGPAANPFYARIASNVLEIVQRELSLGYDPEAEVASLQQLLGNVQGDLGQLNSELCRQIQSGEKTLHTPGLAEHLWQVTCRKIAIDQPSYSTYKKVMDAAGQ